MLFTYQPTVPRVVCIPKVTFFPVVGYRRAS